MQFYFAIIGEEIRNLLLLPTDYKQIFRWFNDSTATHNTSLSFDNFFKVIRSTTGIRVVEIRSPDTELVLEDWVFTGRVLKFSFQIPEDIVNFRKDQTVIIVVEDTAGSLLKETVHF